MLFPSPLHNSFNLYEQSGEIKILCNSLIIYNLIMTLSWEKVFDKSTILRLNWNKNVLEQTFSFCFRFLEGKDIFFQIFV